MNISCKSKKPKIWVRPRSPRMTIALAMWCMDGMVLCADSLETDGVTKRMVPKLWHYEVQHLGVQEWGIAIASAGEADLADSFNDNLKEILGNCDFDEEKLLNVLKMALRAVRITYKECDFGFLAAIYGNPKLYSRIFRVTSGSSHLGPVRGYQAIGIGGDLANYLASYLYSRSMCVADAVRLGIFIINQAKIHVDGCGGPTAVTTYGGGFDSDAYRFRDWGRNEIDLIEAELSDEKFRESTQAFWTANNPQPRFPRAKIPEGGRAVWSIHAKLNTMPLAAQMLEDRLSPCGEEYQQTDQNDPGD